MEELIPAVSVGFDPTGAALYFGFAHGNGEQGRVRLWYPVQLADSSKQWITLSTGEKFEDLDSSVYIFAKTDDFKNEDDQERIGFISYYPADGQFLYSASALCSVEVFVPKNTFDELLTSARLGRVPSCITVEVEGMQYRAAPDDWSHKWDNKAFPKLAVISIRFGTVPLVTQSISRKGFYRDLRDLDDQNLPPTRSQFNQLAEKLDLLAITVKSGLRSLLWVGLTIIGTLILFFLR